VSIARIDRTRLRADPVHVRSQLLESSPDDPGLEDKGDEKPDFFRAFHALTLKEGGAGADRTMVLSSSTDAASRKARAEGEGKQAIPTPDSIDFVRPTAS
jgi:hypothetical protein